MEGPVTRFRPRAIGLATKILHRRTCAEIATILRLCDVPEEATACTNCSSNKSEYLETLFPLLRTKHQEHLARVLDALTGELDPEAEELAEVIQADLKRADDP